MLVDGEKSLRTNEAGLIELAALTIAFIERDGERIAMFTTLTTFGTPRDITVDELAVELFFPADDRSDDLLRAAALTGAGR